MEGIRTKIIEEESRISKELKKMLLNEIHFSVSCGLTPIGYQSRFLVDNSDRIIFVGGRQVGKTTMVSLKALFNALKNPNWTVLVLAPTFRQSKIVFDKMREILLATVWIGEVERMTQTSIYFKNGSRIFCLPSGHTGETIRGYSANLIIIDEGAYVPEEVYVAIVPSLSATNGKLWLIGTPAGKIGFFWGAWNSNEFSKHHATMYDNRYISKEFIEELRNAYTEIQFQQEVLGQFVEEVDAFYPPKLVRECAVGDWQNYPKEDKEYYLGVDVARYGGDETAYVIVEKDQDQYRMVWYHTTAKKPLTDVVGRIKDLHKKWNFRKIFIDETGIGAGPVDDLKEALGSIAEGIQFTTKSKAELHKNLKYLMEQKRMTLLNDPKVQIQFTSIRYEYTSGGNLKIIKSDDKAIDDIVDATALAVSIEAQPQEKWYALPKDLVRKLNKYVF